MEPELSPEPEAVKPDTTQYDEDKEAEMLRQVEAECARQGEAELKKEETEMYDRVGDSAKTKKGGMGKDEEGASGKRVERSDWGEEEWEKAGIETERGKTEPARPVQKGGELVGEGGSRQELAPTRKEERKTEKEDAIVGAPKGPNPLPRFCNHCKLFGHSDLTCYLQGNALTPGPSNYQKPFKLVVHRTPRRGLGVPRGETKGRTGGNPLGNSGALRGREVRFERRVGKEELESKSDQESEQKRETKPGKKQNAEAEEPKNK